MKYPIFYFLLLVTNFTIGQQTKIQYLSGKDKDHTVDWEFKVSGGRNSGEWRTIPVPSNWEMQGFGTYHYWSDWAGESAPDSIGNYRYRFDASGEWKGKDVKIVFGGVMTDAEVSINGKKAGPVHQGGFYQFGYDIGNFIKYGEQNLLEVNVKRFSDNESVNLAERRADFWMFSGIYRPVWIEIKPKSHIDRVAVDANHTGGFSSDVFVEGITKTGYKVTAQIMELNGDPIGDTFEVAIDPGQQKATLATSVKNIKPWSAEWPNRYQVKVILKRKNEPVHEVIEKFGFRSIDVRKGDGVYVNDKKVRLKGTNRHTFWPTSGRTTSKELSIMDVNLIKDMNMNAVRMSHYPPDKHFLEATDSLGLYVLDELTGWQDEYDAEVGARLIKELVVRDVNHPSVIFWDNGNEGGWNYGLDKEFARWDPQNRIVLHPWETFGDINTTHYEIYDCCTGSFFHGDDLFMPTEFLHGLYDGGNGAGLADWWNLVLDNPLAVGGFLWAFADEGIVRDDQDGEIDVAGNRAPDGIVGPYREKEGSFFTVREIWSPLYLEMSELDVLPDSFDGRIKIENFYDHTNLDQVRFNWKLVEFPAPLSGETGHQIVSQGEITPVDVPPHQTGFIVMNLPENWHETDALYLTAIDPYGREIYTWSWMTDVPDYKKTDVKNDCNKPATGIVDGDDIVLKSCDIQVKIEGGTGMLKSVSKSGREIPLSNGPAFLNETSKVTDIQRRQEGENYVVEVALEGTLNRIQWTLQSDGWLRLNYSYHIDGDDRLPVMGVKFSFPEEQVTGFRWLGKGPYRVWKNREKGVEFDVWQKNYNNTITGLSWDYPEFKGFHGDIYWATLQTRSEPITMVFTDANMYLQLFTPGEARGEKFDPRSTHVEFAEGDISILRGIAPIGTKFHKAEEHGPAGSLNWVQRHGKAITDEVYFYFGPY